MIFNLLSTTKTGHGLIRFRRIFLRFLGTALSLSVSIFGVDTITASTVQPLRQYLPIPSEDLSIPSEETLLYDVQLLMFQDAAKGLLRIRRVGERRYKAELIAETKGFLGFLSGYQKNHYVSELEYRSKARRLVPHRFTKTITTRNIWGKRNVTRTSTEIDYSKGEIHWSILENDTVLNRGSEPARREIIYEDLLSVFFNFRYGAYGSLPRGRSLTLAALPDHSLMDEEQKNDLEKNPPNIGIRIADDTTEREYRHRLRWIPEKSLLVFVKVPKEFFGQETSEVRVWLYGPDRIPVSVTVEQAILFGDIFGVLRKSSATGRRSRRTSDIPPKNRTMIAASPSGTHIKKLGEVAVEKWN